MSVRYSPPSGYRKPGQPYSRYGYDGQLWLPSRFGKRYGLQSGGALGFLRSIATRASLATHTGATSASYTNRTFHISRDAITNIQVGWANCFLATGGVGESAVGTQTQFGQVEYPAGNFMPLTWSGNASVVAAPLALPLSDQRLVNIPANTGFWIESRLIGSSNLVYGEGTQKSLASGDRQQAGGTNMSNVVDDGGGNITFPALIVGLTNKRAALGIGDSRFAGFQTDQAGAGTNGDNGDFQTAFSPNYAGTRYGCVAMTGASFSGNHAVALLLAAYHTDVIYELAINDLNAGTSAAALEAITTTNLTLFTALKKKAWLTTIQPSNTSSDSWATLVNQTLGANDAARVTYNTAVRAAAIAGASGFYEYANLVESSLNSGKWKVDGTANKYTSDGTHLNNFSTPLIGPQVLP